MSVGLSFFQKLEENLFPCLSHLRFCLDWIIFPLSYPLSQWCPITLQSHCHACNIPYCCPVPLLNIISITLGFPGSSERASLHKAGWLIPPVIFPNFPLPGWWDGSAGEALATKSNGVCSISTKKLGCMRWDQRERSCPEKTGPKACIRTLSI